MATNSSSSKSDDKDHISYTLLDFHLNHETKKATCRVQIPSDDLSQYDDPSAFNPEAILNVKKEDDLHCINMMRDCIHRNILRALVVAKKDGYIYVWTESYTGSVLEYLESTALGTDFANAYGRKIMLPTFNLQSFISQIFDGLEYLRHLGKYHGNLKLENTYYHISGGQFVVKLTDFKLKDAKTIEQYQAQDIQAVGAALESISEAAEKRKADGQNFDCCQIDDLAKMLKEFSWGELRYFKEIKGHPFFWDYNATKLFFISQIPLALIRPAFRRQIAACEDLCTLPWDNDGYYGLVTLMDDYRLSKNLAVYDKGCRVAYVQFLSGLYAHEKELKIVTSQQRKTSVDTAVRQTNPRVFLILYNLIPRSARLRVK